MCTVYEEVSLDFMNCSNYRISTFGDVYSLPRRGRSGVYLRSRPIAGYPAVTVVNDDKKRYDLKLHRAVALAFIHNKCDKCAVNHVDAIKTNPTLENLEWVTAKENAVHSHSMGLQPILRGSENGQSLLKEEDIPLVRQLCEDDILSQTQIGDIFGVGFATVSAIKMGNIWKHLPDTRDTDPASALRMMATRLNKRLATPYGKGYHGGELNGMSKLTKADVHRICEYLQAGQTAAQLRDMGYPYPACGAIKQRKTWKSISKDYIW